MKKYIGTIEPFIFSKSYDRGIPSTHWSNADELIAYCKEFIKDAPNGKFPTEEWLRKRGKWKNREGQAYNTLSIYIKKWIGGIRQLRRILDQPENSTIKWTREKLIEEYMAVHDEYGFTAGQIREKIKTNKIELPENEIRRITNIDAAVRKYFDCVHDINDLLNIKNTRSRSKKSQENNNVT